jgi:hypothetical protein
MIKFHLLLKLYLDLSPKIILESDIHITTWSLYLLMGEG